MSVPLGVAEYNPVDQGRKPLKRQVLLLWSGAFAGIRGGEARELPNGAGFMLRPDVDYSDPIRVECPAPRTPENYRQVDAALSAALETWYISRGWQQATVTA